MSQSAAPTSNAEETTTLPLPGPSSVKQRSFLIRLQLIYLLVALVMSLGLAGLAGFELSNAPGSALALQEVIISGLASVLALVGLVGTWRGRGQAGAVSLVLWGLVLLGGGLWLFPVQRSAWLIATLLPTIYALLLLNWRLTPLVAGVAAGLFWGMHLLLLPTVPRETQEDLLLMTGMLALVVAILTSVGYVLQRSRGRVSQHLADLEASSQALDEEKGRLERMSQQWALERSRLATMLDLVPDGLVVADSEGVITMVNPGARRLWTDFETLEGHRLAEWQADSPGRLRVLTDERDGTRRRLVLEQLLGQRRVLNFISAPVPGPNGDVLGYIGLFHNQTAEIELEQMRSQFLDLLVQDMQDPLTSILSAQDTLLATEMAPGSERVLATARRSTTRLLDMVNTLLEMSKLQNDPSTLHRFANPLRPLIESSVAQVTPLAQQRAVNLVMEYGADGGPISFDADKMRRVMLSLLDNALKHSPAYSTIRVQAAQSNGIAQVRITDQGPGILPEQAERIFERFSPVTDDRRSAGLGLAFCKLVIEAHGGRIWVESAPGKGSTFAWSLPAAEQGSGIRDQGSGV